MENMTGIFSSRIVAGQLFEEADMVIGLLLDCKLRIQEIKLPTTIHSIMGNLELCYINSSSMKEDFPPPQQGKLFLTINPAALKLWFKRIRVNYMVKPTF